MPLPTSPRFLNLYGFLACCCLLAYAYYAQFQLGLDPCPLCIFQRVGVILLGIVFLLAAVHPVGSRGGKVYAVLIALSTAAGALIAGWHVYLQNLPPDQVPACGPGLGYMLDVFSLSETLAMVFTGSGECAVTDWAFLGLSMPAWVLVAFVFLGVYGTRVNWRRR